MALLSTLAGGLNLILVSKVYEKYSYCSAELLAFYAGIGTLAVCFITHGFDEDRKILSPKLLHIDYTYIQWIGFCGIGVNSAVAFLMLCQSLKMIHCVIVSFVRALEIIFAYLFQILLFDNTPTLMGVFGGMCVFVSSVIIPLETQLLAQLPEKFKVIF